MDGRGEDDFDEWFVARYPQARAVARRILGSPNAAEDAAAEAFTRALVDWHRVSTLPHRDAWVLRVTSNVAIDAARRLRPEPVDRVLVDGVDENAVLRVSLVAALARLPRRQREAIALRHLAGGGMVVVALVVGAVAFDATRDDAGGRTTLRSTASTTLPAVPGPAPGESLPMAASVLSGRSDAITAWTGRELLVWRGHGELAGEQCETTDDGAPLCGEPIRTDGARYDPTSDSWRPMAESPMPPDPGSVMVSTVGVWTGEELVVWGGPGPDAAAYDPDTDTWRTLDPGPLSARMGASAVWTGDEVVVLGGTPRSEARDASSPVPWEVAALDPTSGRWRTPSFPPSGPGLIPSGHRSAWTGSELLRITNREVGPGADDSPIAEPARMHIVDLDRGAKERRLPDPPLHVVYRLVLADRKLVAFGERSWGAGLDQEHPTEGTSISVYDLTTNRWSDAVDLPDVWEVSTPVWTGSDVVFVAGDGGGHEQPAGTPIDVRAFDPATGAVRDLDVDGLTGRIRPSIVWTGSELLIWGGEQRTEVGLHQLDDGVRFRPR